MFLTPRLVFIIKSREHASILKCSIQKNNYTHFSLQYEKTEYICDNLYGYFIFVTTLSSGHTHSPTSTNSVSSIQHSQSKAMQ